MLVLRLLRPNLERCFSKARSYKGRNADEISVIDQALVMRTVRHTNGLYAQGCGCSIIRQAEETKDCIS